VDYQVELKKSLEVQKNCFLFYLSGAFFKNHSTSSKSESNAAFFYARFVFFKRIFVILAHFANFTCICNILQTSLIYLLVKKLICSPSPFHAYEGITTEASCFLRQEHYNTHSVLLLFLTVLSLLRRHWTVHGVR
jgi:predicted membrane protein